MDYTQRLRDLRADHDMSQAAIAAAIGIDQKQYSRYETGINELPLRYLVKLCQVYQVSADLRPRSVKWDLTDRRGAHGAH